MTDKELRGLKRRELLELMYYLQKELEDVKRENDGLRNKLKDAEDSQSGVNDSILEIVKRIDGHVDSLCKGKASVIEKVKETERK